MKHDFFAIRIVALLVTVALTLSFACMPSFADSYAVSIVEDADIVLTEDTLFYAEQAEEDDNSAGERVTFIVVLEGEPLLENNEASDYSDNLPGFFSAPPVVNEKETLDIAHEITKNEICEIVAEAGAMTEPEFVFDYTALINGFSVETEYRFLDDIRNIPGVKAVYADKLYAVPEPVPDEPLDTGSNGMIGVTASSSSEYNGAGMLIAIIDTGVMYKHPAFTEVPEGFYDSEGFRTAEDIEALISENDFTAENNTGFSASTAYISPGKIAFAYDYGSNDTNADPSLDSRGSAHGTHVAGIAAGYSQNDGFFGVAPYAQLAVMKIANSTGGIYSASIFAALQDCLLLGVDVINMSLGADAGFTDPEHDVEFNNIYKYLKEAGISLVNSAGNSATSSFTYTIGPENSASSADPDYGMVSSDSTFSPNLSVASIQNAAIISKGYSVEGQNVGGETVVLGKFVITDTKNTLSIISLTDKPYVICGYGSEDEMEGVTLNGAIAVMLRGGNITFIDKINRAKSAGAAGIIICNYENADFSVDPSGANYLPCGLADRSAYELLKLTAESYDVHTISSYNGLIQTSDGGAVSVFSSVGATPDLRLKPEVAAPGGSIYSSIIYSGSGARYGLMSGTSMAAPHVSGAMAAVKQYLNENHGELDADEKYEIMNCLLLSTAHPLKYIDVTQNAFSDGYNTDAEAFASPRAQGAGIINITDAVSSPAYLSTDDSDGDGSDTTRPIINLGEDSTNAGSYRMKFKVTNISDSPVTYSVYVYPMRPEVINDRYTGRDVYIEEPFRYDTVTVPANETVDLLISYRIPRVARNLYEKLYENGSYVEGYIRLIPTKTGDDAIPTLSIPFLGFYGEWESAPIFDTASFGDEAYSSGIFTTGIDRYRTSYGSTVYTVYKNAIRELGSNIKADEYNYNIQRNYDTPSSIYYRDDNYLATRIDYTKSYDRIALSPENLGNMNYVHSVNPALLRNVKLLTATVTAGNKTVFYDEEEFVRKSLFYPSIYRSYRNDAWLYRSGFGRWYGIDENGNYLPNNTKAIYTLSATLDYEDYEDEPEGNKRDSWSFPIYIDSEKPVIDYEAIKITSESDGSVFLNVNISDNHFLSYTQLYVKKASYIAVEGTQAFYFGDEKNLTLVYDITKFLDGTYGDPVTFVIDAYDCAMNTPDKLAIQVSKSDIISFSETIEARKTLNLSSYDAGSAYVRRSWKSDNKAVAAVSTRGVLTAVAAGEAKITAKLENGKMVTFFITVEAPKVPDNVHEAITINRYSCIDLAPLLFNKETEIKTWSTNRTYVTSVSRKGYVRATGYTGTVTIIAYFYDGSQEIFTVTVK